MTKPPSDLTVQRDRRTRVLWQTFLGLMLAEGHDPAEHDYYRVTRPGVQRNIMRRWLGRKLRHRLGDLIGSPIEAADLGVAKRYEAVRRGEATGAQPGSPAKIAVLAERVAAGVELFHGDDWQDPD